MARIYNKHQFLERRRYLRRNMTKPEILLWSKLKCRQMHGERFVRQFGVDEYVIDFYCPRLKLAIEVDGESHFFAGARENDERRQHHIESYGIRFLRITGVEVCGNIGGVCHDIYETIERLDSHQSDGV